MVVKILGGNLHLYLRQQLDFFNINYRGLNFTPTWVRVGYEKDQQIIINRQNGIVNYDYWIKLIGFSRIDGAPIFQVDDNYHYWHSIRYDFQDLINHVGLTILHLDGSIHYMRNDFVVERLAEINDFMPYPKIIKPKGKQIFSLVDPYGEELWEE